MLELLSLRKVRRSLKKCSSTSSTEAWTNGDQIIDVFICKLRKKLANASFGKNYIETVWAGATPCENQTRPWRRYQPECSIGPWDYPFNHHL